MEQIYHVDGVLSQGFVGHVSYATVLRKDFESLHIVLSFEKREVETKEDKEVFSRKCEQTLREQLGYEEVGSEVVQQLTSRVKTEISLLIFIDDQCIGSANRDLTTKEVTISATASSPGIINCSPKGILRVVLHVLNVPNDQTNYSLKIQGEVG